MKLFLIKLLLRLLEDSTYKAVKDEVIQSWIVSLSAENSGYKGYYTIRKKSILSVLSSGIEQKEYWVNIGRLAELKHLNQLSTDLSKKYANKNTKKGNEALK